MSGLEIPFKGKRIDGIINYLYNLHDVNPATNGLVEVTASGSSYNEPYVLCELGHSDSWASENVEKSWFQIDFKEKKVLLKNYTLRMFIYGAGDAHPKNWQVLGSNDGVEFKVLVDVKDGYEPDNGPLERTFPIAEEFEPFRIIRLLQTDVNSDKTNEFVLSNVEFFGTLF